MRIAYIVIYTDALEECRAFYAGLGIDFRKERHGHGPEHYAAVLDDGSVFELYPAAGQPPTGRLRLGLTTQRSAMQSPMEPGQHIVRDPDGRVIDLKVAEEGRTT